MNTSPPFSPALPDTVVRNLCTVLLAGVMALSIGCDSPDSNAKVAPASSAISSSPDKLSYTVEVAQDYNRLFYHEDGWTGADVAASLSLRDGRILWLFGDTWIGTIRAGHHTDSTMVHNTVGIQRGLNPMSARLDFFHGDKGGKPDGFLQPTNGTGYFWPTHGGVQTDSGLYLFMSHITNRPGDDSVWSFASAGMVMAKVTNPQADPDQWRVEQIKVPWAEYDHAGNERVFGMPLVRDGEFIYLYGLEISKAANNRYLLVGRVKTALLEDFSAWKFYANGEWQSDFRKATHLADHLGAELSVSYLPRFKRYVMVYTENGLSEKILLRHAITPVGPWSEPVIIYRAPEMSWDASYFCYAAKAHPELSKNDDELIVSYVCNSSDFGKMATDARIYFPKFLRLKFEVIP